MPKFKVLNMQGDTVYEVNVSSVERNDANEWTLTYSDGSGTLISLFDSTVVLSTFEPSMKEPKEAKEGP